MPALGDLKTICYKHFNGRLRGCVHLPRAPYPAYKAAWLCGTKRRGLTADAQQRALQGDGRPQPQQPQPSIRLAQTPRQAPRRKQQAEARSLAMPTVMTSFPEHLRPDVLANGVLLVDKPQHWEVPEVVAAVQRATGADKVASVAPLDAAASGLMLLCFGSATRLAPRVERAAKRYTGTLVLGVGSLSGDVRGGSFMEAKLPVEHFTDDDLAEAAQGLVTAAADNVNRPLRVLPLSRRLRQLPSSSEYYEEHVGPGVRTTEMELLEFRVWREAGRAPTFRSAVAADALDRPLDSQAHHAQPLRELPQSSTQASSSSLSAEHSQQLPAAIPEVVLGFSAQIIGRSHVRSLVTMYGRRLRTTACLDNLRRTHVGAFDVEEAWPLEALVPVLRRHRR